jgi:outer membrane translocation and assembly module TamA
VETSVALASRYLGSKKNYVRWNFDARGFVPLGPCVVAGRVLLGSIAGINKTSQSELPVTELFYSGGSAISRGYDFQKLGNDNAPGRPVGGQSLLSGSLELRFPIWRELRGVTFGDAGQLGTGPYDWRAGQLRYSVGGGLRYTTPLGPIRLDIATPLNAPSGVSNLRFWFAIGQAF